MEYAELVGIAGSPQKLGNITSGLVRRWKAQGGTDADSSVAWEDVPHRGRRMPPEFASQFKEHFLG